MGRKIPGKKHHGVKDPLEQLARRNELSNFNAPPSHPDEQEVPRSVLEIARLKKVAQNSFKKKKPKKKNKLLTTNNLSGCGPTLPGMTKDAKRFPTLVQWPGESEESFLQRLNETTDDIINEAQLEEDFSVSVTRNSSGTVESIHEDYELSEEKKLLKTKFTVKKKKKTKGEEVKPKKNLNRHQRLKLKKAAKLELERGQKEFSMLSDKVKFGEVAHRPPQFTARPKGTDKFTSSKPGKKNLLLKGMLNNIGNKPGKAPPPSMASRKRLETQRAEAVAAYRAIKAKRHRSNIN